MAITVLSKLVALSEDSCGYITYVFELLEDEEIERIDSKYIMCVQYPNWEQKKISIEDEGYLNVMEVKAGVDTWWDGVRMVPYRYNTIQFLKFVERPKKIENKYIM